MTNKTTKETMIKTTITQDNINNGKIKCNNGCPVALSFKNHKDIAHVSIFDNHSRLFLKKKINGKTVMLDFNHSPAMLSFVKKFDNKEEVLPQSFILNKSMLKRKILL